MENNIYLITSISAAHPWLRDENRAVPLDILIYKLVKSYIRATPFKRAALKVVVYYVIVKILLLSFFFKVSFGPKRRGKGRFDYVILKTCIVIYARS